MKCLIDGDLVVYRAAASAELEAESIAKYRVDDTMNNILDYITPDSYECFLTGKGNFRKELTDTYKANRTGPKPKWLQSCRDYLVEKWQGKVVNGYEADDALGIGQCDDPDQTIIASLDKDLLMIPGNHYNWVKNTTTLITAKEADRHLYWQMLVGDTSDNIPGIRGIGPKKADKILTADLSVPDMFDIVRSTYNEDERFMLNLNLFYILQAEGQLWNHRYMDLLIQSNLVQLAEAVERKCSMYVPKLYSGNGLTELDGTLPNGIGTEVTD